MKNNGFPPSGTDHTRPVWTWCMVWGLNLVGLLSLLVMVAIVCIIRFANIQSLVLPAWVDSVHHSALVHLILQQHTLPSSYRPFADVDQVYYHLGYHVLIALAVSLTGVSVEQVMLIFGQVLNVLACVSLYVLAAGWTRRSLPGLVALLIPGTISLMPAYYVSWGRYTQLTGLVILPIAMLLFARAVERGGKRWLLLASIVIAALFLVHYRVTIFFAIFALSYLLWHTATHLRARVEIRHAWLRGLTMALLTAALTAPWIWRLLTTVILPIDTLAARMAGTDDYNAVPVDLLFNGTMPSLLALAALGALISIWRGKQYRPYAGMLCLWTLLTGVLLNPSVYGGRPSGIVNNFSAVIALYVPLALLIALGSGALLDVLEVHGSPQRLSGVNLALNVVLVLIALLTAPRMIDVANPVTNLAGDADIAALDWIRAFTPADARFLINERRWQGNAFVGTDAGYWIPNLTGRQTTMPIVFYTQGSAQYIAQVNSLARVIDSGPDPDDPAFLTDLQARGVTHVYIGVIGGPLPLPKFQQSVHYAEVYAQGGVHIFEIRY